MGIYDDYGKELPVYRVIYQRWLMNGFLMVGNVIDMASWKIMAEKQNRWP